MNRTKIEEMLKEAKSKQSRFIEKRNGWKQNSIHWESYDLVVRELEEVINSLTSLLAEDGGEVKESSDVCVWTHTVGLDKFDVYKSPHVGVSYRHGKPDNCLVCGKKIVIAPSQHSTIVKDEAKLSFAQIRDAIQSSKWNIVYQQASIDIVRDIFDSLPPAPSKGERV